MLFMSSLLWASVVHMFNTFSMKNYFVSRRMSQGKSDKIRWEIDSVVIGQAMKNVIDQETKLRVGTHTFGI
jgi:hypothetical protein